MYVHKIDKLVFETPILNLNKTISVHVRLGRSIKRGDVVVTNEGT